MKKPVILLIFFALIVSNCKEEQILTGKEIMAVNAHSTLHLNLYVAHGKGLFSKRGLDVRIISTNDGVAEVQEGNADIVFHDPTDVVGPMFKKKSSVVILPEWINLAIIGQGATSCNAALVVPIDSPVKQYSDLDGMSIAGISTRSCAITSMKDILKRKHHTEFTSVMLTSDEILVALETRGIEAAVLDEPLLTQALLLKNAIRKPKYRTVFNDIIEKNIPGSIISANSVFLQTRTYDVRLFLDAIDEANHIISANPAAPDIVSIAGKHISVTREALAQSNHRLNFNIQLDTENIRNYADTLLRLDIIKLNPEDSLFAPQFKGITW